MNTYNNNNASGNINQNRRKDKFLRNSEMTGRGYEFFIPDITLESFSKKVAGEDKTFKKHLSETIEEELKNVYGGNEPNYGDTSFLSIKSYGTYNFALTVFSEKYLVGAAEEEDGLHITMILDNTSKIKMFDVYFR